MFFLDKKKHTKKMAQHVPFSEHSTRQTLLRNRIVWHEFFFFFIDPFVNPFSMAAIFDETSCMHERLWPFSKPNPVVSKRAYHWLRILHTVMAVMAVSKDGGTSSWYIEVWNATNNQSAVHLTLTIIFNMHSCAARSPLFSFFIFFLW